MSFFDNLNKDCSKGAKVDIDINGGGSGGGGTVYWSDIVGKPLEFPPTAHTHTISDVDGLNSVLSDINDSLEDAVTEAELTPLLENKANKVHTHVISDITGLQGELNSKADLTDIPDVSGFATTTELTDGLAGKANTSHTHTISQISGLQLALDSKLNASSKGSPNGLAELDGNGKVPSSQLPSYVDDVLSYPTQGDFPSTGESGKIYIAENVNLTYRWSGSAYVEISPSLALGENSSTAYRGDRGKIAYDHTLVNGNPHNTQIADIPNLTDIINSKVDKIVGKGLSTNDYSNADKAKLDSIGEEWFGTRSEYEALGTYNPTTKYFIEKEA